MSAELDPEITAYLKTVQATMSAAHKLTAVEMREQFHAIRMAPGTPAQVHQVRDVEIPTTTGAIKSRIYKPVKQNKLPVLVWFHGGGWVLGDLESADLTCRDIAAQSGCIVLSVDYRLAPEHVFPAAFNDCLAALRWTLDNCSDFGADKTRVAIGGDSAGANLASCVAIAARDLNHKIKFQLLVYPVIEADFENSSYTKNADGYFLTKSLMQWFWDQYVPQVKRRTDPRVAPLQNSLQNLPPAWLLTAGFDPLRDEGIKYAEALQAAGVTTCTTEVNDTVHGFFTMPTRSGARARAEAANQLKIALS